VIAGLAGLAAALVLAGVGTVVLGALPLPRRDGRGGASWLVRHWRGLSAGQKRLVFGGLAAGAVVLAVTRWVPALVIVPAAVIAGPRLLGDPVNRDILVLEALDRWVRALTASLLTGRSVPDAIRSTRRQAPDELSDAVTLAALRLDERWTLPDALAGFADDVDHADADAVAAALVVAGQRGTGAAATLEALADSLQDRLAAAREIDNERAKPRIVVRQVTAIIGVVLVLALITSPAYFAPYRSGVGPWIALGLALVYIGSLARLQSASRPRVRARLRQAAHKPRPDVLVHAAEGARR